MGTAQAGRGDCRECSGGQWEMKEAFIQRWNAECGMRNGEGGVGSNQEEGGSGIGRFW